MGANGRRVVCPACEEDWLETLHVKRLGAEILACPACEVALRALSPEALEDAEDLAELLDEAGCDSGDWLNEVDRRGYLLVPDDHPAADLEHPGGPGESEDEDEDDGP